MMDDLKESALMYADRGLAVFPIMPPRLGGSSPGKRPYTEHGCKDATTNKEQIEKWWTKYPDANIGIATGSKSGGLLVIDLDVDEDKGINGYEVLKRWEKKNGNFPDTWSSITGRGGYHFFFRAKHTYSNKVGLYDGVDIRSEGGYIIAPPSLHANGNQYEWEYSPDEIEIAEVDEIIGKFLEPPHNRKKPGKSIIPENEIIHEGGRIQFLVDKVSKMLMAGIPKDVIKSAIREINKLQCDPEVAEEELEKSVFPALERDYWQPKKTYAEEKEEQERIEKGLEEHEKIVSKLVPASETAENIVGLDLNKNGTVKQNLTNCVAALANDSRTRNMFRYNLFTNKTELTTSWWKRISRNISDTDENNIFLYLDRNYGLKCDNRILQAIDIIANENSFHPVQEKINALVWDGKKRIDNLFSRYLGAEKSPYLAEVTRLFLLGAISRIFEPGCKFDTMIVLVEDKQGGGKSSMARFLAMNDEWFSDDMPALDKDKAFEKLQGHWIMEMSEMLATTKASTVEAIKAFISRQSDIGRPAYGHNVNTYPRQCVFIGTTNNISFLPKDRTGNRRFLPIQINSAAAEHHPRENELETREYIEQCWAEAMAIYRSKNFTLALSKEMSDTLEKMQEDFKPEDPDVGIIQDWLDNNKTENVVCTAMIYKKAFPENEFKKPQKWELSEISNIMNHNIVGWKKYHTKDSQFRFKDYGKQRAWERENVHKVDSEIVHKNEDKDGFLKIEDCENLELPFK